MPKLLDIPKELMDMYPGYSKKELRAMITEIWKSKNNRLRQAHIFRVSLPDLGVLKSRGNKRPKRKQSILKRDRERKRKLKPLNK